jgi:hypothetical protein
MSLHLNRVCWTLMLNAAKTAHVAHALDTLYHDTLLAHGIMTLSTFAACYVLFDVVQSTMRRVIAWVKKPAAEPAPVPQVPVPKPETETTTTP